MGFGEGVDVAGAFGERGGLNAGLGRAEGVGRAVAKAGPTLQGAAPDFQGKGIGAAGEIEFADFKNAARRPLDFAPGGAGGAGQPLHFESPAVGDGVALGLLDQHHDVLVGIGSRRVLRHDGYAVEYAQIVKTTLRIDYLAFAQGLRRLDLNLALDDLRAGVIVAGQKDAAHVGLRALVDAVGEADRFLLNLRYLLFGPGFLRLVLKQIRRRFRGGGRNDRFVGGFEGGLREAF